MIDANNNILGSELYWQKETQTSDNRNGELSQEDFFAILTQQLSMQDPSKPVDNDQMIAQMTSFSMAESLNNLNDKFDSFANSMTSNQALQASSLIGQNVLIQSNQGYLADQGGMTGVVVTDQPSYNMEISITDQFGQLIRTFNAGDNPAGNIEFHWDGTDAQGNMLPPGNYQISANAKVAGENTALPIATYAHVNSVSLAGSAGGIVLNLDGLDSVKLADVIEIGEG